MTGAFKSVAKMSLPPTSVERPSTCKLPQPAIKGSFPGTHRITTASRKRKLSVPASLDNDLVQPTASHNSFPLFPKLPTAYNCRYGNTPSKSLSRILYIRASTPGSGSLYDAKHRFHSDLQLPEEPAWPRSLEDSWP
jgi:hypothetical protein